MRTLILTPDFPPAPGGIQLLVYRLASTLRETELRVVALGGGDAAAFDRTTDLEVIRVGHKGAGRNRLAVAKLNAAAIRRGLAYRPSVVLSAHVVTAPAAAVLRSACRAAMVQYLHADEIRTRPGLVRRAMGWSDGVIAVSRHTRDMALELGCDPQRLSVIPPGVDIPAPTATEKAPVPTVVTVARLVDRYKGHDVMIRALPLVRRRVPAVRWAVVGDGPLRQGLEELARREGVAEAVEFVGSVSDAERDARYDSAHIFAMPSRLPEVGVGGEGFGIVYMEAASHGLPSVAGDVAGARDAVVAGQTGLLVDPTDPEAVAGAIADILLDPELAARMGDAARARAEEFSWPRIAARVEEVLQGAVASRGAG